MADARAALPVLAHGVMAHGATLLLSASTEREPVENSAALLCHAFRGTLDGPAFRVVSLTSLEAAEARIAELRARCDALERLLDERASREEAPDVF